MTASAAVLGPKATQHWQLLDLVEVGDVLGGEHGPADGQRAPSGQLLGRVFMYIKTCRCIYIHIYFFSHTGMCTYIYIYTYVCVHVCMYSCTCMRMRRRMRMRMCT